MTYTPRDWYWLVGADTTRWFSSASGTYVTALPADATPTRIASEQDLWDVLDAASVALPNGAATSSARKDDVISRLDVVAFKVLFNHENRLRVLEGKQAITAQQFKVGVKALL